MKEQLKTEIQNLFKKWEIEDMMSIVDEKYIEKSLNNLDSVFIIKLYSSPEKTPEISKSEFFNMLEDIIKKADFNYHFHKNRGYLVVYKTMKNLHRIEKQKNKKSS